MTQYKREIMSFQNSNFELKLTIFAYQNLRKILLRNFLEEQDLYHLIKR